MKLFLNLVSLTIKKVKSNCLNDINFKSEITNILNSQYILEDSKCINAKNKSL